jgi:hypothetical protein
MYIGIGTVVLIVIIVLVILMLRRRLCPGRGFRNAAHSRPAGTAPPGRELMRAEATSAAPGIPDLTRPAQR